MFPTSDDFTALWDFLLNSDCLSVPGKLIDGQVLDFDEVLLVRWKLVIGDLKVALNSSLKMSPYTGVVDENLEC